MHHASHSLTVGLRHALPVHVGVGHTASIFSLALATGCVDAIAVGSRSIPNAVFVLLAPLAGAGVAIAPGFTASARFVVLKGRTLEERAVVATVVILEVIAIVTLLSGVHNTVSAHGYCAVVATAVSVVCIAIITLLSFVHYVVSTVGAITSAVIPVGLSLVGWVARLIECILNNAISAK